MGSRLVLPLLLVAALVSSALVFWFSSDRGRSGAPLEAPRSAPATRAPEDGVGLARPSTPDEPAGSSAERLAIEPISSRTVGGARKAHEESEEPNLSGRVVDRLGMPVRDARVSARAGSWFFPDEPAAETREAQTDIDGRFEIFWPRSGDLRLGVRSDGFAPHDRMLTLAEGGSQDLGAIVLSQGAILSGRVVDSAGRPVPDAELLSVSDDELGGIVVLGGRRETVARAGRDGSFRIGELACGPWRILVRSDLHPERVFEGAATEPGVESSGLVFELEAGTTISGWATGIPAEERGKLSVRAVQVVGDEQARRSSPRTAILDAEGRFTLQGLALDATYDLRLWARSRERDVFAPFGRTRSETRPARAGDNGVVLTYLPGGALVFQVVDGKTQEPIERCEVEAGIQFPEPLRGEDGRLLHFHPGGRVRVDGLRPNGDAETVTLSVHATGYEDLRQEVKLAPGQELDLGPLFLTRVPRVKVHVTDARTGDPIPDARVTLAKDQGDRMIVDQRVELSAESGVESSLSFGERTALTDEKGDATLTSFEGETCLLSVQADGFARAEQAGLFLPRGEDVEHAFALTGGGEVLVRVFEVEGNPLPGAKVRHRPPSAGGAVAFAVFGGPSVTTDSEGRARFRGLETGVHGFQLDESRSGGGVFMDSGDIAIAGIGAEGPGGAEWTEVEVREDAVSEIELRASPRGELSGIVREGGRPFAGANVSLSAKREEGALPGFLSFGGGEHARTDGHGEYRFADLKSGLYTLSVEHPSRAMPAEFEFEVEEGENRFDIELPVSIVEGRITDPSGRPLPGISVRAERVRERESSAGFMIAVRGDEDGDVVTFGDGLGTSGTRTDADGRYSLRGVASDVELVVRASGDGVQEGTSESVSVGPDRTRSNVDLVLEPAGSVEVEALLADGSPAQMCMVRAHFLGEGEADDEFGFIQSRTTKLDGLRPGTWRINVSRATGPEEENPGTDQDVEVLAGETAKTSVYLE